MKCVLTTGEAQRCYVIMREEAVEEKRFGWYRTLVSATWSVLSPVINLLELRNSYPFPSSASPIIHHIAWSHSTVLTTDILHDRAAHHAAQTCATLSGALRGEGTANQVSALASLTSWRPSTRHISKTLVMISTGRS